MRILACNRAAWFGVVLFLGVDGLSVSTGSCSSAILWKPCPDAFPFECGSFQVPLDYAHPEAGDATLAVARLKATAYPRLGTIFTNPGGPGISGLAFLLGRAGKVISTITKSQYDIISWDPRGVNQSSPQISCGFTSLDSYVQFLGDSIPLVGFEARGNFTDCDDIDAFFAKVTETDAILEKMGQRCQETDGSFLKYMGTTAVVKDMVCLSESIDRTGVPINYWGFSYGTVIGNYFVNMFPHRVGRVVLDGVVDSVTWATEPTYKVLATSLSGAESALQGFAEKCSQAGSQNCIFAHGSSTAVSILQGIRNLINTAYDLQKVSSSSVTSFNIRAFIGNELFTPLTWDAELVPQLESWKIMFENQTANSPVTEPSKLSFPHGRTVESRISMSNMQGSVDPAVQATLSDLVISCVDSIDQAHVTTERYFKEVLHVTHDIAPTFGEITAAAVQLFCHRFPIRAVERFTGPFNRALANAIIIIGNTADPVTPLANAKKIAEQLGPSARLVEQNGIGHTSLAQNSDCIQAIARKYFLYGELPPVGLMCETDQALFPPNNTLISINPHAL